MRYILIAYTKTKPKVEKRFEWRRPNKDSVPVITHHTDAEYQRMHRQQQQHEPAYSTWEYIHNHIVLAVAVPQPQSYMTEEVAYLKFDKAIILKEFLSRVT